MIFLFSVSLGSVPELPAESCAEIRASEGESAISGNYWVDLNKTGNGVLVPCDMSKLGKQSFGILPRLSTSTSSYKRPLTVTNYLKFKVVSIIRGSVSYISKP